MHSFGRNVLGAVLTFMTAAPALAQDVDAMAKWTALTIVHYRVVGEFDADAQLFMGSQQNQKARATDRIELEFDWDQQEMKLGGKPVFRNFPTKFKPNAKTGCPAIRIEGALDVATVLSIKDPIPGTLTL